MSERGRPESALYFEEQHAKSGERRRETLERLKEACDGLVAKGSPLGLKAIEREVQSRHGKNAGPKAQSLANASGAELRRYVDLREAERAAYFGSAAKAPQALAKLLKTEGSDPVLVSRVMELQSELDRTKDELKRAKALLASGQFGVDPASPSSAPRALPGRSEAPPKCLVELASLLSNQERLPAIRARPIPGRSPFSDAPSSAWAGLEHAAPPAAASAFPRGEGSYIRSARWRGCILAPSRPIPA